MAGSGEAIVAAYFRDATLAASNPDVWHVGEPLPNVVQEAKILSIKVDGDELTWLFDAVQRRINPAKDD